MTNRGTISTFLSILIVGLIVIVPLLQTTYCLQSTSIISYNSINGVPIYDDFDLYSDINCSQRWESPAFNEGVVACYKNTNNDYSVSSTATSLSGIKNVFTRINSTSSTADLTIRTNYSQDKESIKNVLDTITISFIPTSGKTYSSTINNWNPGNSEMRISGISTNTTYTINILVEHRNDTTITNIGSIFLDFTFESNDGTNIYSINNNENEILLSESRNNIDGISLDDKSTSHDMCITDNIPGITIPDGTEAAIIKNKNSTSGSFCNKNKTSSVDISSTNGNPFLIYLYIPDGTKGSFSVSINYIVIENDKEVEKSLTFSVNETGYIGYQKNTTTIIFDTNYVNW